MICGAYRRAEGCASFLLGVPLRFAAHGPWFRRRAAHPGGFFPPISPHEFFPQVFGGFSAVYITFKMIFWRNVEKMWIFWGSIFEKSVVSGEDPLARSRQNFQTTVWIVPPYCLKSHISVFCDFFKCKMCVKWAQYVVVWFYCVHNMWFCPYFVKFILILAFSSNCIHISHISPSIIPFVHN